MDITIITDSDVISAIGYEPASRRLRIQFTHSLRFHEFRGVPEYIHLGLLDSPRKGEFYERYIRDHYGINAPAALAPA